MTDTELHEFATILLIGYLDICNGNVIKPTGILKEEHPHMIVTAPNGKVFDFWIKVVMHPLTPTIELFEHHTEIIHLAKQVNAIPVFAGVKLTCMSNEDSSIPICGGRFKAEFTGIKQFKLSY
ncbi:MAG: hypothetical protein V1903_02505 [Bacteroidota bacterium]